MTYIVVSENEIVKAEMERPECFRADDTDEDCPECWPYIKHCLSLPRIHIHGKHNWKVWQEVEEWKEFRIEIDAPFPEIAIPIQPTPEVKTERFKRPTGQQIVHAAILFNDGKVEKKKLSDMVALCDFVIDRLYENGDMAIPSSKENK